MKLTKTLLATVAAALLISGITAGPASATDPWPPTYTTYDWNWTQHNFVVDPMSEYDGANRHYVDVADVATATAAASDATSKAGAAQSAATSAAASDATTKANAAQAAATSAAATDATTKMNSAVSSAATASQSWTPKTKVYSTTTAAGGTATFSISGMTTLTGAFATAVRNVSTPPSFVGTYVVSQSTSSVVVQCTESKTTTVLILNTAVEGLEACPSGVTVNLMVAGS